ncbi:uncharacterized protein B0I36DRAFT_324039 [Microdochium trichocladiopsis]|uniref:Uncharacterized protein n=1 Tax=Microdochium trichocladiopsis TaxID=1682393 RepID=A0A9P9BR52_9PEZI|nr:uncharacterized protein B0I36DRAFT_324039 [Microdochium trichocladiopsis]KAH7031505.1 hypothetical protein B0I36DRAFT_324039 [Microdochium trichocladiopsis]
MALLLLPLLLSCHGETPRDPTSGVACAESLPQAVSQASRSAASDTGTSGPEYSSAACASRGEYGVECSESSMAANVSTQCVVRRVDVGRDDSKERQASRLFSGLGSSRGELSSRTG